MAAAPAPDRLADLQSAMRAIAEVIEGLPPECRDLAGNALLNVAAEAVVEDVGCVEAGRIFARLADLLVRAPHWPIPHPNFVPLKFRTSLRTQSRGMSSGTSTVLVRPLTFSVKGME
jgi:hypothetical protein